MKRLCRLQALSPPSSCESRLGAVVPADRPNDCRFATGTDYRGCTCGHVVTLAETRDVQCQSIFRWQLVGQAIGLVIQGPLPGALKLRRRFGGNIHDHHVFKVAAARHFDVLVAASLRCGDEFNQHRLGTVEQVDADLRLGRARRDQGRKRRNCRPEHHTSWPQPDDWPILAEDVDFRALINLAS
jgi:hypothetical protein